MGCGDGIRLGDQGREGGGKQRLGARDGATALGLGRPVAIRQAGGHDIHVATGFLCQPPKQLLDCPQSPPKPSLVFGANDGPRHRPAREGFVSTERSLWEVSSSQVPRAHDANT